MEPNRQAMVDLLFKETGLRPLVFIGGEVMESDENDYGRFHKGSPDIMEKHDAQYQLEEALREIDRLQSNAQRTLHVIDPEVGYLVDPVTSLSVIAIGLKAQLDTQLKLVEELREQVRVLNQLIDTSAILSNENWSK